MNLVEMHTHSYTNATRFTHTIATRFMSQSFMIRVLRPYTQDWHFQSFSTMDEAQRMIQFYKSCGSPAELVTW